MKQAQGGLGTSLLTNPEFEVGDPAGPGEIGEFQIHLVGEAVRCSVQAAPVTEQNGDQVNPDLIEEAGLDQKRLPSRSEPSPS